ncbi:MAG TPA: alpha/beta hydrolase [Treponema sp.]|nr:alpha/beta hydrolase [Treponema sp.]
MTHENLNLHSICTSQEIKTPNNGAILSTYIPDNFEEINPKRTRAAVIICPGGGYEYTSTREGEPIALRLNALGIAAFVLHYSCAPTVFPTALCELAAAVALLKKKTDAWHLDPKNISVMGFSAGGHLAASLGCLWNSDHVGFPDSSARPDAMILSYPVITSNSFGHEQSFKNLLKDEYASMHQELSLETRVTKETPPAFIWHTHNDNVVPVENSMLFAMALREKGVPFELHIYQPGGHGLSTATPETQNSRGEAVQPECANWLDMAATWIKNNS